MQTLIWHSRWFELLLWRFWPAYAQRREDTWLAHVDAGVAAQQQGDYAEAEAQLTAAIAMARKFGPDDPRVASSLTYLGSLYHEQERYADAEPLFEMSLAKLEKIVGRDNPAFASQLLFLANVYRQQARYDEAESMILYALKIIETSISPDHPEVARGLEARADLLRDMGREAEAAAIDERAKSIRSNWQARE